MAEISVSFDIYDAEAVRILQEEDPDLLPDYSVNAGKDLVYNKKQVTNAITSGIIKGESIPKIASNLQSTMKNLNQRSAIGAARTAATSAHNAGKLSTMKELAAMGVEVQKEWVATLDDRTRESHRKLDGERRNLDERFSNGLMYPGASGSSKETWQCRCTMVSYIPEYDSNDEPRLTYSEWEKYKKATGSAVTKITKEEYNSAKEWSQANAKIKGTYQEGQYKYSYEYDTTTGKLTVTINIGNNTKTKVFSQSGDSASTYEVYMKKFDIENQLQSISAAKSVQSTDAKITQITDAKQNAKHATQENGEFEDSTVGKIKYEYDSATGNLVLEGTDLWGGKWKKSYDISSGTYKYSEDSGYKIQKSISADDYNKWLNAAGLKSKLTANSIEPKATTKKEETVPQKETKKAQKENESNVSVSNETRADLKNWENEYRKTNSTISFTMQDLPNTYTYTTSAYSRINKYLRGIQKLTGQDKASMDKTVSGISAEMKKTKLASDIVTVRGVDDISYMTGAGSSFSDAKKLIGKTYKDKGFLSTSAYKSGGFGGIRFEITVPKDTTCIYCEDFSCYKGNNEYELLLDKGTTLEITDVVGTEYDFVIYARVVSQDG